MKKVHYTMIFLLLTALTVVNGQEQGMGQRQGQAGIEKLTSYKIAFFTQRLNLTPAEAEKFWPLYNDYSARKSKIQADRITLMRYAGQNESNMSQDELTSTADKLSQTFVDEAGLVVSFNNDLRKVLSPAKVIKLYQTENQYKQQLLRELNQRGQAMRGRRNPPVQPEL